MDIFERQDELEGLKSALESALEEAEYRDDMEALTDEIKCAQRRLNGCHKDDVTEIPDLLTEALEEGKTKGRIIDLLETALEKCNEVFDEVKQEAHDEIERHYTYE